MKFIKIPKYNLYPDTQKEDIFEYICNILNQTEDPETLEKGSIDNEELLYCSPLKRSTQSISQEKFIILNQLREIPFELKNLISEDDYEREGSIAVRRAFKEAFISDKLLISREQIQKENEYILSLEKNAVFLSHTFRIALILIQIKTKNQIYKNPKLVNKYIDENKKIMEFKEITYIP